MKRKNIVDELIKRELSTLDDICEVLEKLKIVEKPEWKEFLTESDARMWYEQNPTTAEKKSVLTALGYDFSELNKKQKLKYENIYPNPKTDFEITYRDATRLIAHLQNSLQQLAAAYKALKDKDFIEEHNHKKHFMIITRDGYTVDKENNDIENCQILDWISANSKEDAEKQIDLTIYGNYNAYQLIEYVKDDFKS